MATEHKQRLVGGLKEHLGPTSLVLIAGAELCLWARMGKCWQLVENPFMSLYACPSAGH